MLTMKKMEGRRSWKILVVIGLMVWPVEGRGINGGFSCAACTILFGMAQQLAEIHNESLLAASLKICDFLPSSASTFCEKAVRKLEPILIDQDVLLLFTPDVFCYAIKSCYVPPGGTHCHLFPEPKLASFDQSVDIIKAASRRHRLWNPGAVDFCSLPWIRELCWLLSKGWTRMEPAVDIDGDLFSLFASARGSHWRGRDCRDFDRLAYPGRRSADAAVDANCNGVHGRDPLDGSPYESALCGDGGRGLVYVGDSVGAHFHFPEAWMNPRLITGEALHNYTEHLLDELDWPHLGFATGFENTSEPLLIQGSTDSVYLRLRARNRCNHRDYQNLSRNGASSFDLVDYVRNVARNKTRDKPALALYASFGNDVCNPFKDTLSFMTSPSGFRKNVLSVLQYLDDVLPDGSHVVLIGLVDGGCIFPTMGDRMHPLAGAQAERHAERHREDGELLVVQARLLAQPDGPGFQRLGQPGQTGLEAHRPNRQSAPQSARTAAHGRGTVERLAGEISGSPRQREPIQRRYRTAVRRSRRTLTKRQTLGLCNMF